MFSFNLIIVMNNSQISPKVVSDSYYYEVPTDDFFLLVRYLHPYRLCLRFSYY